MLAWTGGGAVMEGAFRELRFGAESFGPGRLSGQDERGRNSASLQLAD